MDTFCMMSFLGISASNFEASNVWLWSHPSLGGCWFQVFLIFTPILGRFPFWSFWQYSMGLKPPTGVSFLFKVIMFIKCYEMKGWRIIVHPFIPYEYVIYSDHRYTLENEQHGITKKMDVFGASHHFPFRFTWILKGVWLGPMKNPSALSHAAMPWSCVFRDQFFLCFVLEDLFVGFSFHLKKITLVPFI